MLKGGAWRRSINVIGTTGVRSEEPRSVTTTGSLPPAAGRLGGVPWVSLTMFTRSSPMEGGS